MENSEKKVVDSENPKAGITNNEQMVEVAVNPIAVQMPTVETKEIVVETPVAIESGKLTNTQVSLYGSVDVVVFGEPGEVCDGHRLFGYSPLHRERRSKRRTVMSRWVFLQLPCCSSSCRPSI